MIRKTDEEAWSTATWKGARLAQLRAARRLSVRQRLLAMEELNDLALRLATMPRANGSKPLSKKDPAPQDHAANTVKPPRPSHRK